MRAAAGADLPFDMEGLEHQEIRPHLIIPTPPTHSSPLPCTQIVNLPSQGMRVCQALEFASPRRHASDAWRAVVLLGSLRLTPPRQV